MRKNDAIRMVGLFLFIVIGFGSMTVLDCKSQKVESTIAMEESVIEKYSTYEDVVDDFNGFYRVTVLKEYPSGKEILVESSNGFNKKTFFIRRDLSYNQIPIDIERTYR